MDSSDIMFIIYLLYDIFLFAMIIRVLLSWFNVRPDNLLLVITHYITEPILSPLRRITPRVGAIDVTPMLAIILLYLIMQLLRSLIE